MTRASFLQILKSRNMQSFLVATATIVQHKFCYVLEDFRQYIIFRSTNKKHNYYQISFSYKKKFWVVFKGLALML